MTVGNSSTKARPTPSPNNTSRRYFDHSAAPRINTDAVIVESLRNEYPDLHLTVTPQSNCNLLAYAAAGHASLAPMDKEKDRLLWRLFLPAPRRLDGERGVLVDQVKLGKYLLERERREFVLYIVEGRDGDMAYPQAVNQYILSPSLEAVNTLLSEAGKWNHELHNEIWVFDRGVWQKDEDLWRSVQKSSWEDIILDEAMKNAIISDTQTFFDSRATYEKFKVPWKRGIIYHGPPGNGKTISIKAMMNSLYRRQDPVPTLYVKTLKSVYGAEYSIARIFELARQTAPCYLVFEDLDSLVTDNVRSYFLNAVDGIAKNDGILMIGSTNHLERLDPGISKRPSRFDRKYLFPNPNLEQRTAYMRFWQNKLADTEDIEFPDKLCPAIARITPGFSFAYLQEAMVASLLAIARQGGFTELCCLQCLETHDKPVSGGYCDRETVRSFKGLSDLAFSVRGIDDEDPDLDNYPLWREIKKQIRMLREELGDDSGKR